MPLLGAGGADDGRRASKGMCAGAGAGTEHFRHAVSQTPRHSLASLARRQSFSHIYAVCPTARVGHLRPERAGGAGGIFGAAAATTKTVSGAQTATPSPSPRMAFRGDQRGGVFARGHRL